MDQQALGSFSCDATTSTGNNPYYQLTSAGLMSGFQPFECEALSAQSPFPYYGLKTAPADPPGTTRVAPEPGVVPNPLVGASTSDQLFLPVGQVTSQATAVGPYGSATPVVSAAATFGISATQYGKDASYFLPNGGPVPPDPSNAPNQPPSNLSLAAPSTSTIIPVIFDTLGIVGAAPLVYRVLYQPASGSEFWTTVPAIPVIGTNTTSTLRIATVEGLTPATIYRFYATVSNGFGTQATAISNFSTAGGDVPPAGTLTTPIYVPGGTNSQVTVQFSANITGGNPVPVYYVYWGLTPTTTSNLLQVVRVAGTPSQYRATASGLTAGTDYYFLAQADKGNPPPVSSAVGGPFRTGANPSPSGAPGIPLVVGTPTTSSITVSVDITGITGTPTPSYTLAFGTTNTPTQNAGTMTINGNTATGTVVGLTPTTNYYFQATAQNGVPTNKIGPVSAAIRTAGASGTAPTGAANSLEPVRNGSKPITNNTIDLLTTVVGINPGSPPASYALVYGVTPTPMTDPAAVTLRIDVTSTTAPFTLPTITGLASNTKYYFQCKAFNGVSPDFLSIIRNYSTTGSGGNTPPSGPPTVPAVSGTPTSTTISMTFDTTGITGSPSLAYSLGFSTSAGGTYTYIPALIVGSGPIYSATVTGLTPNTQYYFKSKVSNSFPPDQISAASAAVSTANTPPPPSAMTNMCLVTFLVKNNDTWQIDTDGCAAFGTLFLTGTNAGKIISGAGSGLPSQADSITYLKGVRALANTKLMVSMGGATGVLTTMMPSVQGARDLVNTIWNSLFGAASPNTLNWSNAAWGGGPTPLFFDGLDLDWENGIGGDEAFAFVDQWRLNVAAYGGAVGKKYLNMAPQSPNSWVNPGYNNSTSPWTNNLNNIPFTSSLSALNTLASGFLTSQALAAPEQLKLFDVVFVQCYNQEAEYLTKPPQSTTYNPVFTTQLAQWAYLVMKARRAGGNTVLCWGFASTDALFNTQWVNGGGKDGAILNSAIQLINPIVSAQLVADGGAPCTAIEWSQGFGMWNSPSNLGPIEFLFGPTSDTRKTTVASTYTVLYSSATYPAPDPSWTNPPLPITDQRNA